MKKLKYTSLIFVLAMFCSTQSVAVGSLENQDMAFAFGSGGNADMVVLSKQEMVETEGRFLFSNSIFSLFNGNGGSSWIRRLERLALSVANRPATGGLIITAPTPSTGGVTTITAPLPAGILDLLRR